MPFKIRQTDLEDERYEAAEVLYKKHLDSLSDTLPKDLLRYFGTDFFHDGVIESIDFDSSMKNLTMIIEATNIRNKTTNSYINGVKFKIYFKNVCCFDVKAKRLNKLNNPLDENDLSHHVDFYMSEVGTLMNEIAGFSKNFKRKMQSLIIQTSPFDRSISLIFEDVLVAPLEPLAFELIESSQNYNIPIFK